MCGAAVKPQAIDSQRSFADFLMVRASEQRRHADQMRRWNVSGKAFGNAKQDGHNSFNWSLCLVSGHVSRLKRLANGAALNAEGCSKIALSQGPGLFAPDFQSLCSVPPQEHHVHLPLGRSKPFSGGHDVHLELAPSFLAKILG